MSLRKYPRVVEAMAMRHLMYNEELAYVEQEVRRGTTMAIYPDKTLPIGHISHDPAEMQHVYDIGREMGERKLEEMKNFLHIK
jgi:predicted patatin/cPLA2 family phospholipase